MATVGGMGGQAVSERYVNALRRQPISRPRDVQPDPKHSEWSAEYTQPPPPSRPTTPVSPQDSQPQTMESPQPTRQLRLLEPQRYDPRYPGLLLQPNSRPISQEQLASEVKSIYAGLTMVETKCIHVDRAQAQAVSDESDVNCNTKLAPDHWKALIALHRTLIHEHHDFFLASQHPSASPALRRLAAKYSMPARMWKHGIHSFLELLRRRLPESIDYMLAFIYLAYQMMALLYETVPAFEDMWIECLGDLGRYRMAIEDEDVRDRETWAGVARSWYSKAADTNPSVGRLYHHLAILARPNALQQLYYYARSLTCVKPFSSARESILTLLDPILGRQTAASYPHSLPIDTSFIHAHGVLFEKLGSENFEHTLLQFQSQLDSHIGRVTAKWKEQGVYIAGTNISGLFDYRADNSTLRLLLELHGISQQGGLPKEHSHRPPPASDIDFSLSKALTLTMSTLSMVLRRIGDKNVLPRVHVPLAIMSSYTSPFISLLKSFSVCPSIITLMSGLSMLPTATALPLLTPEAPVEEKRTTYSDDSIGDWIISGAVLVYLAVAYWLDPKTRKLSLAGSVISATFWVAMVSEGDRPEFPSDYRWNILKTWAATTITLTCQSIKSSIETANHGIPAQPNPSCSESITHKFLFQLFAIFALIQVTGMAIQSFEKGSFLNALPPCFSIAVLITSKMNQNPTQHSGVANSHALGNPVSTGSSSNPIHTRTDQNHVQHPRECIPHACGNHVSVGLSSNPTHIRPSRLAANTLLRDPSCFEDVDLASITNDQTESERPRPGSS